MLPGRFKVFAGGGLWANDRKAVRSITPLFCSMAAGIGTKMGPFCGLKNLARKLLLASSCAKANVALQGVTVWSRF